MSNTPSIDYSCPDCGATTIYELVPSVHGHEHESRASTRPIPSLDFSCSRCGATHTYTLMPATARSNSE
jgi:hypothetical protein